MTGVCAMIDRKPCVLCVDDFDVQGIREFLERRFEGDIEVLAAIGVHEAKLILADRGREIDVAVLDIFMPDKEPAGLDLGRKMGADIPIIFISSYPQKEFAKEAHGLVPVAFVEKTTDEDWYDHLGDAIRGVLDVEEEPDEIAADKEYARRRSHSFGHTPATVVTVRFHVDDLPEGQAEPPAECLWDFGPLCLGYRHVELCVTEHHGRILHCHALSAHAIFPAVATEPDHFTQALRALFDASATIENRRAGHLDCPRFSAGIMPGTIVTGLVGERNPGHAAVIGRLADVAGQIALIAKPGEVGTVRNWLGADERAAIKALGRPVHDVDGAILGLQGRVALSLIQT